jgi:hypothetical protein
MDAKQTAEFSAEIETVRRRFEQWRKGRPLRTPIPESLWTEAVALAGRFGTARIAKILRLGYYALKKRLERQTAASAGRWERPPAATFLELAAGSGLGGGLCLVEWEDASGAKMRVQIQGVAAADLVALSRSFWEGRG